MKQSEQALHARIEQWFRERRSPILAHLQRIVAIPSISRPGDAIPPYGQPCRDALDAMLQICAELGFQTENGDYHCGWAWRTPGDITGGIGIWSHLDVVPPGENWQTPPFTPTERDGFLIGRGVLDNKGAAIASVYAALCLEELGVPLGRPLRLFFGCNEECGMEDIVHYRERYPLPALSITPDTRFPVCFAEKGLLEAVLTGPPAAEAIRGFEGGVVSNTVPDSAEITLVRAAVADRLPLLPKTVSVHEQGELVVIRAAGVSRHVAFPQGSVNAIALLTDALVDARLLGEQDTATMALFSRANAGHDGHGVGIDCRDELSGALTCVGSLCRLTEDRRPSLTVNIRYPVQASGEGIEQALRAACRGSAVAYETLHSSAPNHFPPDHPVVHALTGLYNEITGDNQKPFAMGGGTYARMLPNAFAYGLGFPGPTPVPPGLPPEHGDGHQPDEALWIDGYLRAAAIFTAALVRADGCLDAVEPTRD